MRLKVKPKRIVSLALAGCMAVSMVPASAVTAFAAENTNVPAISTGTEEENQKEGDCGATGHESDVHWELNSNTGVLSITGEGAVADYTSAKNCPWYPYAEQITSVTIGDKITRIGDNALRSLGIKSINIPASVTSIGDCALTACKENESITVDAGNPNFYSEDGVLYEKTAEGNVLRFYPAKKTTGVFTIPNNVTVIGAQSMQYAVFSGIEIPASVTKIEDYAFAASQNMKEITIPATVTSLGIGVLKNVQSLESVTLLANVTEIQEYFMFGCTKVTSIEIPDSVTTIGKYAFSKTGLTEFSIDEGSSLEEIGAQAFDNCKSLTSVKLHGSSLKTIGVKTFNGCTSLKDVDIATDANLELMGENEAGVTNPFYACNSLANISIGSLNGTVNFRNHMAMSSIQKIRLFGKLDQIKDGWFQNVSCKQYDLSGVTDISFDAAAKNPFYYWRSENKMPTVYVGTESVYETVAKSNKQYMILAMTNGGTLPENTAFVDGKLATPEKVGYNFAGWYTTPTFDANTKLADDATPEDGKTYYAKWSEPSELTTDIGEKTFVVGEPVEFSFTTAANGDEGTPVIGTSNFSDADAIEKLEYYEVNTPEGEDPWKPVTSDIGGSDGFPMADKELKFRVTFKKVGDYTFTASMKKAGTDTVLCSTKVNFTVGTMQAAATVTDEDGTSMTSYKANEPVRVTLKAAPNDPEAFKKNTLSLTYGNEVEKVELNSHELSEKSYQISDLLDMMDTADAQAAVQAMNAGETITIPLDVTYKTNGEHPFKMEVRNNAGTTVCEKEVTVKISDEEPMPVGSHTLTVKGGTVKVNGAKVDLEKNLTTVPEDATVEVTFDQDAFADSGLKFGHWDIKGLEDPNAYQDKESFTFTMPAGDVTLEAMPQDATIEDGPDILGTAAVITTAAVGGAVLAWQGYQIGTELYLTYLLPAGAAIPANTAELAKLVWTDAGKPAPAAVLPEDATEEQQAMAWAVETGLISADKAPDASVSKTDVIKTWKKAQSMKQG